MSHHRTSPYDQDLRDKVIALKLSGVSAEECARIFNISSGTIRNWDKSYKTHGHCKAKVRIGKKPSIDKKAFVNYVKANPNMRSEDIGKAFNLSKSGALYWLKQLNCSYKKKNIPMWNQMQIKKENLRG